VYVARAVLAGQVTAKDARRIQDALAVAWLFLESLREKAGVPNGD